ncbi:hypothetical protein Hs30E_08710 [Lactococcus hodotermopsidis]|uniref:VWFA domain-containing protein n=1 Tax=Pseudolactococcus hodotermopsidis TaxID=2709157 RepID=A0A6A0BA42_9LACT|nr:VWA domain-containing protein [Lactococcus hodotermopsidis]GFH42320.1 hypothetical protein Hs30E_08710 [Lactococcus hodotermopsidis]
MNNKIEVPGESHLACVLLLDTSGSMSGESIRSLNEGVKKFVDQVSQDELAKLRLDVAIVEFNDHARVVQDFLPIASMTGPTLSAGGLTHMGEGIKEAVRLVKERNLLYATKGTPAHMPWIFMITDGRPEGEAANHIEEAIELVQREEKKSKLKFWSLAVDNADKTVLHRLSQRVFDMSGHDFAGIFDWMAESMSYISVSRPDADPDYAPLPQNVVPSQW